MPKSNAIYWGEGGQIGPFDVQEDGWPHAGQVMRYFREKLGITAKTFGKLYGKEVRENGKPICERWILEMELENKVPTDITRRRIIAHLLSIPPVLLGLASLEDVLIQQEQEQPSPPTIVHQSTLQKVPIEIATYEKNVRIALQLHRTGNAQTLLQEVNSAIKDLENFEGQTKGNLLYRVRELLISNRFLAAKIVKDQRQYALAYMYANNAVYVAKSMEDDELLAAAKYIRGCTKLEWGLFGVMKRGRFQLDSDKIKDAIADFQEILHQTHLQKASIHPQLHGFTMLQLGRAQSVLKYMLDASVNTNALILIDQAANMVGREAIDDLYTRMLITGTVSGLHIGGYHLVKAGILNTIGLPGKAINELHQLKRLTEQTYGQDETRYQAWSNIDMAEAFMRLGEYEEAINKAKEALVACHNINSVQNVTIITDLYTRIAASSYGASRDVKELGDLLKEWYS